MRIGNRKFSPRPWPVIATIILVPVFISLGFWQLDRAEQKRTLHQSYLQNQSAEALSLNRYNISKNNEENIVWRKVIANGKFNENIQILLDNQVQDNQAGYFVFTPFLLNNKNVWYLVNRGWVPAGNDRSKAPPLKFEPGILLISGSLKYPQGTGILLGENVPEKLHQGIYRVNKIDLIGIGKLIDKPLMPFVVRLDPESKGGYIRQWELPGSGETMHLGYAFQWFVLACLVFIIFVVVNLEKEYKNEFTE